jgi:tRNA uridine 5-carboxymethylaminomethyl modification enzyme
MKTATHTRAMRSSSTTERSQRPRAHRHGTASCGAHRRAAVAPAAASLKGFGFDWGRLKTGTPPRLDRESIDFNRCAADGTFTVERGDEPPVPFSFLSRRIERTQIDCHLIHTNDRIRDVVRANVDRSPLFNGQIQGIGPRYCPSLEDKIVRFPDKERHQVFLEPEGVDAREIYVNGFSTSLPRDVQLSSPTRCRAWVMPMLRPGLAVEYDFIHPLS